MASVSWSSAGGGKKVKTCWQFEQRTMVPPSLSKARLTLNLVWQLSHVMISTFGIDGGLPTIRGLLEAQVPLEARLAGREAGAKGVGEGIGPFRAGPKNSPNPTNFTLY
jgi:hypothetical protein